MKLLLSLLLALTLTLAWQTSVMADNHGGDGEKKMEQAQDGSTTDSKKKEEPDCE
jgi:hypothetical protein